MSMVAEVLVELSHKNIDKTFEYTVPDTLKDKVKKGMKVEVPFGNTTLEGFVLNVKDHSDTSVSLKEIKAVMDDEIVLNDELLALGKIMQEHTLSTLISCYQTMLPKALKAHEGVTVSKKYKTFYELVFIPEKMNTVQQKIIESFQNRKEVSREELLKISSSAIKTLLKQGVLKEIKKEEYRLEQEEVATEKKPLTDEQQKVVREVLESNDIVYLLHGVTGSGKTEVYMELIDDVLLQNKTAIVLVPEISLTPQMIRRFQIRFGKIIAVLHSALSDGERYDEWRKIRDGNAKIVIGARSALFAPLKNVGLIIIDEEHSDSYKQDEVNPRYDAKDMAICRAKLNHGCKVIMGSATPSLDAYARAQKGVYHLLKLPHRVNHHALPTVHIIDMNESFKHAKGHFSEELLEAIQKKIENKEQVILLLNRRGYASFISCKNCGYAIKCPHCDITLTYHKSSNNLRCHYCGYAMNLPDECPSCHEHSLSRLGVGTERIEEELKKYLPTARVLRMDIDTTSKKGSHKKMITAFQNHEYDILLGTQIVAKGLDFENVTLVGIINADTSLNIPDFRSSETTFSLLSQVSGRAGRSKKEGEVYLQTFNPTHYAIVHATSHDYIGFYQEEMKIRKILKYPPYYYLVSIGISSKEEQLCYRESLKIAKALSKYLQNTILLGPSTAMVYKVNNVYRYGIILKYQKEPNLMIALTKMIDAYKGNPKLTISINFNPGHC